MRVAYIDEAEETVSGKSEKVYYSVLVKGHDKLDEVLHCQEREHIFLIYNSFIQCF